MFKEAIRPQSGQVGATTFDHGSFTLSNGKYDYEKFYRIYPFNIHDNPERYGKIAKLCRGKVLDLGCGTGGLSDHYLGEYVGIDISKRAVELAINNRRGGARFAVADLELEVPRLELDYDTIVMGEFLEHIADDTVLFNEIREKMATGTRIIVSVPNGDAIPCAEHVREFTEETLKQKLNIFAKEENIRTEILGRRIIAWLDIEEKRKQTVALVMIVKNEGKGLRRAVESARKFVDKVYITVDKESRDDTLEIAKEVADHFSIERWEDSFAKMRAKADEKVKEDWIMFIDGHEYIKEGQDFHELLKGSYDGLQVQVRMESGFTFYYPRIYKRGLKWEGDVHNLVACKNTLNYQGLVIQHDRENGQDEKYKIARTEQRNDMVIRIMTKRLKENRKDARAMFYLAVQNNDLGNKKEAIKWYKKNIKTTKKEHEKWESLYNLATIYAEQERFFKALKCLKKAEKIFPQRWETAFLGGVMYMDLKMWKEAGVLMAHSLVGNNRIYQYNPLERNIIKTWEYIGVCLMNESKIKEAKTAYQRAIEEVKKKLGEDKNNERLKLEYGRYKTILGLLVQADNIE